MKYRYTKYTGDLLDEIDLEDLVSKLSDMLLSSGFSNPWGDPSEGDEDRTMQALHDAILEALFSGGVLSEDALQQLLGEPAGRRSGIRAAADRGPDPADHRPHDGAGLHHRGAGSRTRARAPTRSGRRDGRGRGTRQVRGHDKALDFLAIAPCGTSWVRWVGAAPAAMTRAIWLQASRPSRHRNLMSLATP